MHCYRKLIYIFFSKDTVALCGIEYVYISELKISAKSKQYFGSTANFSKNNMSVVSACRNSNKPLKL